LSLIHTVFEIFDFKSNEIVYTEIPFEFCRRETAKTNAIKTAKLHNIRDVMKTKQ